MENKGEWSSKIRLSQVKSCRRRVPWIKNSSWFILISSCRACILHQLHRECVHRPPRGPLTLPFLYIPNCHRHASLNQIEGLPLAKSGLAKTISTENVTCCMIPRRVGLNLGDTVISLQIQFFLEQFLYKTNYS